MFERANRSLILVSLTSAQSEKILMFLLFFLFLFISIPLLRPLAYSKTFPIRYINKNIFLLHTNNRKTFLLSGEVKISRSARLLLHKWKTAFISKKQQIRTHLLEMVASKVIK